MLDVHPPHHAPNTWRDFFIHIATISVGLLIAVGLEQAVEALHHRHQAHQAIERLHLELDANSRAAHENITNIALRERQHRADLGLIQRLRLGPLAPGEGLVFVHANAPFSSSAWASVRESGISQLLPYDTLTKYDGLYSRMADITAVYAQANVAVQNSTAVLNTEAVDPSRALEDAATPLPSSTSGSPSKLSPPGGQIALSHLTPAQIDRLEIGYQEAIENDRRSKRLNLRISRSLDAFLKEQH